MTTVTCTPRLSAAAAEALSAGAMADGIATSDLLEQAIERELRRRERRRALIERNRRLKVFPALQARTR